MSLVIRGKIFVKTFLLFVLLLLSGCSVFGKSDVNTAPYTLLAEDADVAIEVRNYESMVFVSTSMSGEGSNRAFRKLFNYITGENAGATDIAMTAPVFMNDNSAEQGVEIAMTAPVFMSSGESEAVMSFVMPTDFTLETTPKPTNEEVWLEDIKNYKVAAIQFSGTLSSRNVSQYTEKLTTWIRDNGYTAIGNPVKAGYNGPMTLPQFRRNEVLIEIR